MGQDLLRNIRIASPCKASWESMTGDERVRKCALCNLNVYSFSKLKRAEILDLIESHEGRRLCGRLYTRADGTVITADCQIGARSRARTRLCYAAALLLSAATSVGFLLSESVRRANDPSASIATGGPSLASDLIERGRGQPVIGSVIEALWPAPPVQVAGMIAAPSLSGSSGGP